MKVRKTPEMYGSLYGEKATVRIVGADSDGALRGLVSATGRRLKPGSTTAVLKLGEAAFNHRNQKGGGVRGDPWPPTNEPPLNGTVCRADFWREAVLLVEPSLKCPLCQSGGPPCAAVFKVWDMRLDDVEAKNKETDKEKKEADFAVACAEPTRLSKLAWRTPTTRCSVLAKRPAAPAPHIYNG